MAQILISLVDINYWAVLVGAVAYMLIGMLWYGFLFMKQWMKLMGFTEKDKKKAKKKGMAKYYLVAFIAALIMSYVLAHFVDYVGAVDLLGALKAAFWIWLGFIAAIMINSVLWEGRPVKLYLINISYQLVSLIVMAVILVLWK